MLKLNLRRDSITAFAFAGLLFWSIRLWFLDHVPVWDAAEYFLNCVRPAAEGTFEFKRLNCSGHPSAAYILPFALIEKFFPGRVELFNLLNSLLAFGAIGLFLASAERLKPGGLSLGDKLGLAALLAVNPFLHANTLHFTIDIGVYFFFALLLFAVLEGRAWLAAFGGLCLSFSKETGIVLFVLTLGFWLTRGNLPPAQRSRLIKVAVVVPILFLLFIGFTLFDGPGFVWMQKSGDHLDQSGNIFVKALQLFDATSLAYFHSIFVVNFNWLLSAVILLAIARVKNKATIKLGAFLLLLAITLTRYKTYNNSRYFLTLYPLLILTFSLALSDLVTAQRRRTALIALVAGLTGLSCFATLDPLAKWMVGTFRVGERVMLAMTSFTGECCGFGRDQLIYNLEFTHFGKLQDRLFARLRVNSQSVISQHEILNWRVNAPVDPASYRRSFLPSATVTPRYLSPQEVYAELPASFTYLLFPTIPEKAHRDEVAPLLEKYNAVGDETVEDGGYRLRYVSFKRKE